jgi:hypothetical protein
MKRYIIYSFLMVILSCAQAQEFKKFKTGMGFGITSPANNNGAGPLFYLEPGYRITDALLINIRLETAITISGNDDLGSEQQGGLGSYTGNFQYYFTNNNRFRPFAGLGAGLFRLTTYKADISPGGSGSVSYGYSNKPGFYTRAGFDFGHLNLSIDYNFITATSFEGITGSDAGSIIIKKKISNNYVGFRLGISIGGGKMKSTE